MARLVRILFFQIVLAAVVHFTDGYLKCLSCSSSNKPRDCQYVSNCGSHEVCFTTQYVTTAGTIQYRTGCRDKKQCPSLTQVRKTSDSILVCSGCCNDTLCNRGLCTHEETPSLASRGPICYSCDQQTDPSSCHVVKQCGLDQECAERLSTYKAAIASVVVGRRSVSNQHNCAMKCCDKDLCNSDCTGDRVVHLPNTTIGHISFTTTPTEVPTSASTTQTTTTTTTTAPTTAHATDQSCTDRHTADYCRQQIAMCTSAYPDQRQWAYQYCRRTCNLCTYQPSNTGSSDCSDTWSLASCTYYKHWCTHPSGDNYQTLKMCRKTCNVC